MPRQRVNVALQSAVFGRERGRSKLQWGFYIQKSSSLDPQWRPHLQKGAVPEAAPDVKHGCTIKAVERAAEYHTLGRALGAVLGSRIGRTLSQQTYALI